MAPRSLLLIILVVFCSKITAFQCNNKNKFSYPNLFPAILIFGDSTVDTGNNNYIPTVFKGNHPPYGDDFPGQVPTGRFSNGKLVPDFLASMFCLKETIPPFLTPNLPDKELLTGVSFASAGSGIDELTTAVSKVIPVSRQTEYLKEYIHRLTRIVGKKQAQKIVSEALVIISAGTNDFIFNFYDVPTRRLQFSVYEYQDYLQSKLTKFIKELYDLGCRRMVVSGLPPIGCLPIQLTLKLSILRKCVPMENLDSLSYNTKLVKLLPRIQQTLPGSKLFYADSYNRLLDMIKYPRKYGFVETSKGCCGTGTVEAGPLCNHLTPVCGNASEFIFWDSIHPGESVYRYLTEQLVKDLLPYFKPKAV
ncbi:OLC1v1006373C1 [Oldenlandia corymbosa var. corymbosa]|uniref:OLC1v1006373C1 n=1 Tax=Oldenlandia corymbosa var. corymbosa TaxID=529605 RepID=A0AAV1DJ00_OLDCO|nr:OLC1v1006373C1 [Oldenlandia corymbosa var. corymbosa]